MHKVTIDAGKIESCLLTQDVDLVEVELVLDSGKRKEVFRMRPVTESERAKGRKESRMGRSTFSVADDGTKRYEEQVNTETYNSWMLYFALGGERKIGVGENQEGWSLKDATGEPLKVTLDRIRNDLHPGITVKLVNKLWEMTELTEGQEKN